MTSPYKKRALSGWSGGKANKHQSNRDERQFERVDIEDNTSEVSPVSKKVNKPKNNKREKEILKALSSIRWALKLARGDINSLRSKAQEESRNNYNYTVYNRYYHEVRLLIPKLDIWIKDDTLSAKIKRHIVEIKEKLGTEK